MKRRDVLLDMCTLAAGLVLPCSVQGFAASTSAPATSLKALGAKVGLRVGAQASKANLEVEAFARFIIDNFNLLTPGNEFKWSKVHPAPDSYSFADTDWLVNFGEAHNIAVHGHNLCWNSPLANPSWMATVINHANARQYLTDHITTLVKRYRGRIDSWDVVNEPVVFWSKRPDGLYPGIWLNVIGEDYMDVAFHATKDADPGALRVLNCYDVEQGIPDHEKTRQFTLTLLGKLLKRGVPVQAVGLESHLDASAPPGGAAYGDFLKQLRDMGLEVLVTELDVDDTRVPGSVEARDASVARCYSDYLDAVIPAGHVSRLIFWTPSNRWDWLDSTNLPAKFRRADKQPHRAGLLDAALQKTPSYQAVAAAMRGMAAKA